MNYVEIDIDGVIRETADAILVAIDNDEVWLPKSTLEDYDDYRVSVSEDMAYDKGLI